MSARTHRTVLAALVSAPLLCQAAVLQQLGDQDFVDGHAPVLAAAVVAANADDPEPFNKFFGSDPATLGSLAFRHSFAPGAYRSATITFGLIDHDSFSDLQDTVSIDFDDVRQDTASLRGISVRGSSVHVVSFDVAPSLLSDGVLNVRISAIQPAEGFAGNGIGVDFSRLEALPVPEPSMYALWLVGLAGIAAVSQRWRGARQRH